MLKQFLPIVFLLLPLLGFSQLPFPTTGSWRYLEYDDFGNFIGYHYFYIDGDSTYMGESWKRLMRPANNPEGLIRQDSTQKVWFVPAGNSQPELLYDFGASIGDTIYTIRTSFVQNIDTLRLDTIMSYGNETVWQLTSVKQLNGGWYYEWIEGVGDRSWLPAPKPLNLVSVSTTFECYSVAPGGCPVSIDEPQPAISLDIFPNPSTGHLRLRFDQPIFPSRMHLHDAHGNLVRSWSEFKSDVYLEDFPAGVYFLSVEAEEGVVRKKILLMD